MSFGLSGVEGTLDVHTRKDGGDDLSRGRGKKSGRGDEEGGELHDWQERFVLLLW